MTAQDIPLPKPVGILQELQRGLHVADVIRVFGIAELIRVCGLRVLRVVWMRAESVADRCEGGYAW